MTSSTMEPPPVLSNGADAVLHAEHDATEVDIHEPVVELHVEVGQHAAVGDPRHVEHDVDPSGTSASAVAINASTSASLGRHHNGRGGHRAPTSDALSASAPLMSAATTVAPSLTDKDLAPDALPMPEPAPVITATLSSNMRIKSVLPGAMRSQIDRTMHYFVKTGSVSQPRTVEVGESLALSMSTSHSGKRVRTSSRAMTPSIRASAAPMHR